MRNRPFFSLAVWVACSIVGSSTAWAHGLKVALVLDRGGKDDKSFNASAYQGANRAKEKLGITLKYVEASDDNAFEPLLRAFAQKDYDLIIAIGVAQAEALKKVAAKYPQKNFAIIDAEISAPNVRSLLFEEQEGAYLVGMIAAKMAPSKKIGFIGGMDIPLIRRFQVGFEAGAKAAVPAIQVTSNYVGVTSEAWNNPARAKELALSQYQNGADVIFAAAGASGAGLFDAAEEKKKFAIGVDSNQNWIKPGRVLTSMLKRVDNAVYQTIEDAKGTITGPSASTFGGKIEHFGLANGGVDYALDQYNEKLIPKDVIKLVNARKAEIIAGSVKVPDYYLDSKKPAAK